MFHLLTPVVSVSVCVCVVCLQDDLECMGVTVPASLSVGASFHGMERGSVLIVVTLSVISFSLFLYLSNLYLSISLY